MIRIHSLTARLATLFAVLTASLLVLAAVFLGRMLDAHFEELDTHELQGKLTLIRNALQTEAAQAGQPDRFEALDRSFVGHESVGVLLRDAEGRVLHVIHPEHFTAAQRAGEALAAGLSGWTVDARPHRGVEVSIALPSAGANHETIAALVALDLSHHVHFLASVRHATWAGVVAAALAAALFGWIAAYRGLAPLRQVTDTARKLSARQLAERLAIDDAPLEVRDHVEAFNGMLARLEAAFQRLGDYSADIAHELRTPISNLMTQTQVALSRPRTIEAYQDILASNLEEYERIARMVSDMLFLAKAEGNTLAHASEPVDLALEADALVDFYEALADERQVGIVRPKAGRSRSGSMPTLPAAVSRSAMSAIPSPASRLSGSSSVSIAAAPSASPAAKAQGSGSRSHARSSTPTAGKSARNPPKASPASRSPCLGTARLRHPDPAKAARRRATRGRARCERARRVSHMTPRCAPMRPSCSAEATSQALAPEAAAWRRSASSRIPPAPTSATSGRRA